ncbi:hypothetical protein E2C01_079569 [Portunus trituberculatus]|uniref:Uncharacterized protein n=1 Tax=Portunus trituberculatus TaxID=210409 RepID=A0A5B7IRR7_PORTR|nr:hypothetical protein [Portunus trituberculatus]
MAAQPHDSSSSLAFPPYLCVSLSPSPPLLTYFSSLYGQLASSRAAHRKCPAVNNNMAAAMTQCL